MFIEKRKRRFVKRKNPIFVGKCFFCEKKTLPDYKKPETLKNCITERGKIIGCEYTGVCSKHQRLLVKQIKRARFLGLLPFVLGIK